MFNVWRRKIVTKVIEDEWMSFGFTKIDPSLTHWSKNISVSSSQPYKVILNRKVSLIDIRNMKMGKMPGFRFAWNYNKQLEPEAIYANFDTTKEFVRYFNT